MTFAQTDEIQVYDAVIAAPGVLNLMVHNNFTPDGLKTPAFSGGLIPDKSLNGVAEWAYGVTDWFEAGLYLPLYSLSAGRGPSINGGKIRLLFVRPHADDRKFFYGANFEFSYNSKHWDEKRFTSEIRPIIGWHLHPVDIIMNPIPTTFCRWLQESRLPAGGGGSLTTFPPMGPGRGGVCRYRPVA